MVQISEMFEDDLQAAIMAVNDIIKANREELAADGLQVGKEWITPYECYALFKLLSIHKGSCLVDNEVLEWLRLGTNFPEDLPKV